MLLPKHLQIAHGAVVVCVQQTAAGLQIGLNPTGRFHPAALGKKQTTQGAGQQLIRCNPTNQFLGEVQLQQRFTHARRFIKRHGLQVAGGVPILAFFKQALPGQFTKCLHSVIKTQAA